ncbi:MAG TPA: hypothetical protein DDW52_00340 [Planctomycetaceae bacterium]|nr:hypothetical protein [Planctomycetaceae bacterium]
MLKHLKWLLTAAWIASAFYLILGQVKLTSPYYAFLALYRAQLAFCLFVNAALTITFAVTLLETRFTTRTLLLLMAIAAISLAIANSFYRHTPLKSGFAYSENKLSECLSSGEVGDNCGMYRVTDIVRSTEYTIIFTAGDRDSFDPCGFIKFSDSTPIPNRDSTELRDAGFYPLGNGWYAFYSYYNSIKIRWS